MPCVEKTNLPVNEEIISKFTIPLLGSSSYTFLTDSTLLK